MGLLSTLKGYMDPIPFPSSKPVPGQDPPHKLTRSIYRRLACTFIRDLVLSYLIRTGIGLLPRLLRSGYTREGLQHALRQSFGQESIRFALAMATFFTQFKGIEYFLRYIRQGQSDGWNAFLAGGLASFSLAFEQAEQRVLFAQYLAVRALQCAYNSLKFRERWYLGKETTNHGDTLLFCLSSASIIYAFVFRPSSLASVSRHFIGRMSHLNPMVVDGIRGTVRGQPVDYPGLIAAAVSHGANPDLLWQEVRACPGVLPCSLIHPEYSGCWQRILGVTLHVFVSSFPMYFSLHFFPVLLFKTKELFTRTIASLRQTLRHAIRSASFMATFAFCVQTVLCSHRGLFRQGWLVKDTKAFYWFLGVVTALAILIEKKSRRSELALYVCTSICGCAHD